MRYFFYLLIFSFLLYIVNAATEPGDFKVFLEASKLMLAGEPVYNQWIFVSEGNYCLYYYSPFWATLLMPFTFIPPFAVNLMWLLLNGFFLFRIIKIISGYLELHKLPLNQRNLIAFLTLLLSARFVLYNFSMIQMTIFILWGCLESVRLITNGKFIAGGIILGMVINIKILPLALVPYLVYRGAGKGVAVTLTACFTFMLLPAIVVGWEENYILLQEWWKIINPSNEEHLIETALGPHSLTALVPSLLTQTDGPLPYSKNILNLEPGAGIMVSNLFRLTLVALTLLFLSRPPFKNQHSGKLQLRELSYILLLVPLIFPHQQKYAFAMALPAICYLIWYVVTRYKSSSNSSRWKTVVVLLSLSFILMTLTTDSLVGRKINKITQHYKLITWGAMLLIPALFVAQVPREALTGNKSEK